MVGCAAFRISAHTAHSTQLLYAHLTDPPVSTMSAKERDEQHMARLRKRAEIQPSDDDEEQDSLDKPAGKSDDALLFVQ